MSFVHPYMPNSAPENKRKMLDELNIDAIEQLYQDLIPERLRYSGEMKLPAPIPAEADLKKWVDARLSKNRDCSEYLNFLGAGCYQHAVPAVCDEINSRSEFLTAYVGDTYSDHGKMQAFFEYASLMAELVDMDVVSYPTFDEGQAVCSSLRMSLRMTNRKKVLLPETMHPEVASQVKDYCSHIAELGWVKSTSSGRMDEDDLKQKLDDEVACVFIENPSFLGFIETQADKIAEMAHLRGALFVVNAKVSSLGVLKPPSAYGADIACGDIQPLGIHMQFGGGLGGFIATRDEEVFIKEFPTYLYGMAKTKLEGVYGWGRALNQRTSHGSREKAKEYFGTGAGLWAITAAVYLSTMGPQGMRQLGETIMRRTSYAQKKLAEVPGLKVNWLDALNYQEFLINFDRWNKSIEEINCCLLEEGIFGGKDLSNLFPQYGQSALYCITEKTSALDIHRLKAALEKISPGR